MSLLKLTETQQATDAEWRLAGGGDTDESWVLLTLALKAIRARRSEQKTGGSWYGTPNRNGFGTPICYICEQRILMSPAGIAHHKLKHREEALRYLEAIRGSQP